MNARVRTETPDFSTTVHGIPCGVVVDSCLVVPTQGSCADSDWDAEGWEEVEFHLVDSKGYRANWLESKLSEAERSKIQRRIVESRT